MAVRPRAADLADGVAALDELATPGLCSLLCRAGERETKGAIR